MKQGLGPVAQSGQFSHERIEQERHVVIDGKQHGFVRRAFAPFGIEAEQLNKGCPALTHR